MRLVLFIFSFFLCAAGAMAGVFDHPAENLNDIAMHSPDKISGSFTQKRFLAELKTELNSSGKFSISKETGLLWQNLSPFQSATIISGSAICTLTDTSSSLKTSPALKEFLDVIRAVFNQDYNLISKHFFIFYESGADTYTIGLRAKNPIMAKNVSELVATGSKYMEKVTFSNDKGDLNILEFSDITEEAAAFSCEK
jgi:archaellum component FlaG (FlaF/FlaG flagellin family)